MTYLTTDEIRDRIEYDPDVFFDINPSTKFDSLLTTLEQESRNLINSYIGIDNETLKSETDKVYEIDAPDNARISLIYPVQDVTKVEVKRGIDDDWETLDSKYYSYSERGIKLKKSFTNLDARNFPYTRRKVNNLKINSNRITWAILYRRVKITYDRGYDTIPSDIKSAQIKIINNLLRNLRQEQNVSALSPSDISNYVEGTTVLTEDIQNILDNQTRLRDNVVVL